MMLMVISASSFGQRKFKVKAIETPSTPDKFIPDRYIFVDEKGNLIRELDTAKYTTCFYNEQYVYFTIVTLKNNTKVNKNGWAAIDADEHLLFTVMNTSYGEPTPDYLWEDAISIIDTNNLVGFANSKGEIFIKPQFEAATTFHKGKAIIAKSCKNIPWNEHASEGDCHHYSTICKEYGYINKKGKALKMGATSFEEIKKEIKWEKSMIAFLCIENTNTTALYIEQNHTLD